MPGRRFHIRTYGCQMNVHDSEKVASLLLHDAWSQAPAEQEADLLVINTCSIREKAAHRLYSDLGALREWKREAPGRLLGVGGCVAQQEGDVLLARFPHLDFVFGPQNLRRMPALAEAARSGQRGAALEESRSLERFDLPERHPALADGGGARSFVTVMEGCDMFCSFCIVPHTRGREVSRPGDAILSEARALAGQGCREITLLGQTVNAWGRHDRRRGNGPADDVGGFAGLLARLDAIPGLERIRYTSPHPIFFDAGLVRAHGELASLCPHVHLPAQSGSDAVLRRMRRRYTADEFRGIAAALRDARPDIAITTDLIVGFPGETDADFEATLALVRDVGFVDSFSFKYSPRPGTAAAGLGDPVAPERAQERLEALQGLQRSLTLAAHRTRIGETTEVLVEGPSRHGGRQLRGRDPQHRVVNLDADEFGLAPERAAGSLLQVRVVEATPHSLLAGPVPSDPDRRQAVDPPRKLSSG